MHKVLLQLCWLNIQKYQLATLHLFIETANLWGSSSHGGPAMPATTVRNHCVRKLKFILTVARPTRGQGPDQGMSFDGDYCLTSASLFITRIQAVQRVGVTPCVCVNCYQPSTVGKRTSCLNLWDNPRGAAIPVIWVCHKLFVVSIQQQLVRNMSPNLQLFSCL